MRRQKDLPRLVESLDKTSKTLHQLHEIMPENKEKVGIIQMISTRYEGLIIKKEYYVTLILSQVEERKLRKEKQFQISYLNIKIAKFKEYESAHDIYSF